MRLDMRRLAAVGGLVGSIACHTGCGTEPIATPPDLRIGTFNIRWNAPSDGENAWEHRRSWVASTILDYDIDAWALQEVTPTQLRDLELDVGDRYRLIPASGGDVTIALNRSTMEVVGAEEVALPADDNGTPRALLSVGAMHHDRYVRIAGVHPGGSKEQLSAIAGALSHQRDSLVLMGDFNNLPGPNPWVESYLSMFTDGGWLIDTYGFLHPNNRIPSGCGWDECIAVCDCDPRIDWILTSPEMTPIDARILILRRDNHNVSDHWPVIATVRR